MSPYYDAWPYRQIIAHLAELWEFLNSPRYRGEPRNIAYAIAGLPELALRSSIDLGTKNPSALGIRLPAFADHIRRHNPTCWTALQTVGVTPDTLKLLRSCCPDCKRLASNPDQVQMASARGRITR